MANKYLTSAPAPSTSMGASDTLPSQTSCCAARDPSKGALEYREAAPVAERPVIDNVIVHLLMASDTTYWLGEIASVAWGIGALAAAVALWNWRISVPLVAAGGLLAWSHFPPFGAAAGMMLGLTVWQYFGHERQAVSAGGGV